METTVLNEKIASLDDLVENERAAREMWVARFEKEHSEHSELTAELLETKNELNDLELEKSNLSVKYGIVVEENTKLSEVIDEKDEKINHFDTQISGLNREIETLKETVSQMEDLRKELL